MQKKGGRILRRYPPKAKKEKEYFKRPSIR